MSRAALIIVTALLMQTGCMWHTRGVPKNIQSGEAEMVAQGNVVGAVHAVFIHSTPIATLAGSFSHIPGAAGSLPAVTQQLRLASKVDAPTLALVSRGGACKVPPSLAKELRRLLDGMFLNVRSTGQWRSLELRLELVPADLGAGRKAYSVQPGRKAVFEFYFPCGQDTVEADVFFAFLKAMHETSHAMFSLAGMDEHWDPGGPEDELLAEGGPACVFEQLRSDGDPLKLQERVDEAAYFGTAWKTVGHSAGERSQWCGQWEAALR